ncbi:MAG: hypothetical protein JSR55_13205 [Proteobacteria bacterium]|nr:hypothetical protein [Pseudomonadota bacterium]
MARISGPIAVLAGLFLTLPGIIALVRAQAALGAVPEWLSTSLVIAALCGVALMVWGGSAVRRRELALHEMEQASRWLRMHR